MSYCAYCGISRDYYASIEHASRQNCRESHSDIITLSIGFVFIFLIV